MSGCLPPLNKTKRTTRARRHWRRCRDELRERHLAQNQIAPQTNHKSRRHRAADADADGLATARRNHTRQHGQQRDRGEVRVSTPHTPSAPAANHLRAEPVGAGRKCRARRTPREMPTAGSGWLQDVHQLGLRLRSTQTCSSTEVGGSFHARRGVEAEFNRTRIHHWPTGMPWENAAHAAVKTFWPAFKFAPPER